MLPFCSKTKNVIFTDIGLDGNTKYSYYDPRESCMAIVFAICPVGSDISWSISDKLSELVESSKYKHY